MAENLQFWLFYKCTYGTHCMHNNDLTREERRHRDEENNLTINAFDSRNSGYILYVPEIRFNPNQTKPNRANAFDMFYV